MLDEQIGRNGQGGYGDECDAEASADAPSHIPWACAQSGELNTVLRKSALKDPVDVTDGA